MTFTLEASTELVDMLDRVSRSTRKQFRNMDLADLQQESWCWALENKALVREHQDNIKYLFAAARRHLVRYSRQWLAMEAGYEEDDQQFYLVPQIRELLIRVFTPDWMEKGQAYDSQPSAGGISDPADAWAMVADVRTAFGKLGQHDKDLLWQVLGEPGDPRIKTAQLAARNGVTEPVMNQRVYDALKRVRNHLGGAKPRVGQSV